MSTVNSTASKPKLQEFARENFGVELPEDLTQKEMYAEVKALMEKAGHKPATVAPTGNEANDEETPPNPDNGGGNEPPATNGGTGVEPPVTAAANQPKTITGYTIEIQKPADTKFEDYPCCVNGRNYQVRFNEPVRVKPEVVESLRLAVKDIPAYKNPEGKVEPARRVPRFIWAIHEKHYD
jgi:hypothetical protein